MADPPAVFIELALGGAGTAVGAVVAWFGVRRKTSGRVGTSDADILWQQGSAIREYQEHQIDKLTEQRDRLIDSQATQVLPLLSGMVDSLRTLGASMASVLAHEEAEAERDRQILAMLDANRSMLTVIAERLSHEAILPGQGTPAGGLPGPPGSAAAHPGEGHAD